MSTLGWVYLTGFLGMLTLKLWAFLKMWNSGQFVINIEDNDEERGKRMLLFAQFNLFVNLVGIAAVWPLGIIQEIVTLRAVSERLFSPTQTQTLNFKVTDAQSGSPEFIDAWTGVLERLKDPLQNERKVHPVAVGHALLVASWIYIQNAHHSNGFGQDKARETFLLAAGEVSDPEKQPKRKAAA